MTSEKDSSYHLIVDKGTLDAITSGGADSPELASNVGKYIREMWRILAIDGRWMVVTTMPPTFFEELVIPHLQQHGNMLSNWRTGHRSTILHHGNEQRSGQIFLYSLTKEKDLIDGRDKSKMMQGLVSSVLNAVKNLVLSSPLHPLVSIRLNFIFIEQEEEEVEELKELETNAPPKAPDRLEIIHNHDTNNNSCSIYLFVDELQSGDLSSLAPGATVKVKYFVSDGNSWTEDDVIRLVIHQDDNDDSFYSRLECCYEVFEFINPPQPWARDSQQQLPNQLQSWLEHHPSDSILWGSVDLTVPNYGGCYHISYLQPLPFIDPSTTAKLQQDEQLLVKQYNRLAHTNPFSISCPVMPFHPDHRSTHNKSIISRRKAIPVSSYLTNKPAKVCIEQLFNIRKVHVSLQISDIEVSESLQRIMVWTYTSETQQLTVLIEFDRINESSCLTECLIADVDGLEDWDDVVIDASSAELSSTQSSSLISFRLSYNQLNITQNTRPIQQQTHLQLGSKQLMDEFHQLKSLAASELASVQLNCRFCQQNILKKQQVVTVTAVHALPLGLFNESLYDFVCCEAMSDCMTLQSEDLVVQSSMLYCGLVSVWMHREMTEEHALVFTCKQSHSLENLFSVLGSSSMTSMKSNKELDSMFQSMINADSCSVQCKRCGASLGDAKLDLAAVDADSDENIEQSVAQGQFRWQHVERVQLLWSSIDIQWEDENKLEKPFEMIVGRVCLYLLEKHNKAACCFYISSSTAPSGGMTVIILRTIAKFTGYGQVTSSSPENELKCHVNEYLKAGCTIGPGSKLVKGNEARLPLDVMQWQQLHDFCMRKVSVVGESTPLYFPFN